MAKLKLVKNGPVERVVRRKIQKAFLKAAKKALAEDWDRVIIIGQGKNFGGWEYSCNLRLLDFLGMLELTKQDVLDLAKKN